MYEFVVILFLLYCWLPGGSALVLGPAVEKPKKSTVKLGSEKVKIFRNIGFFATFLTVKTT